MYTVPRSGLGDRRDVRSESGAICSPLAFAAVRVASVSRDTLLKLLCGTCSSRCEKTARPKCVHNCLPHEPSTHKGHFRPPPFKAFPSGPWHIRSIQHRLAWPGKFWLDSETIYLSGSLSGYEGVLPIPGSWQPLKNKPNVNIDATLLLTDGTVMGHEYLTSNWFRLVPDDRSDYANGTWIPLSPMPNMYRSRNSRPGEMTRSA